MEAYKAHIDFLMADGVAETAYVLTRDCRICGTNLPIQELPTYQFKLEQDDNTFIDIVVNERDLLMEALANNGVCKAPTGLRIYNQKYYPLRYDAESGLMYFRKEKGGACIAITPNYIIMASFNTDHSMKTGGKQNPASLNLRVEKLAESFK